MGVRWHAGLLAIALASGHTGCSDEAAINAFRQAGWSEEQLTADMQRTTTRWNLPQGVTVWKPAPVVTSVPQYSTRTFRADPERQDVLELGFRGAVESFARCRDPGPCWKGCEVADEHNWECWEKGPDGKPLVTRSMSDGLLTLTETFAHAPWRQDRWFPFPEPTLREQIVAAWLWWKLKTLEWGPASSPRSPAPAPVEETVEASKRGTVLADDQLTFVGPRLPLCEDRLGNAPCDLGDGFTLLAPDSDCREVLDQCQKRLDEYRASETALGGSTVAD